VDSPVHRETPAARDEAPPRTPLPVGYRQGIITAITVVLGFTLAFLRFWGFEAKGSWTYHSFTAAMGLTLALVLQIVALFRSLRVEDEDVPVYRVTVRVFVASVVVLVASLVSAAVLYSGSL
jgi:hypothetical protein